MTRRTPEEIAREMDADLRAKGQTMTVTTTLAGGGHLGPVVLGGDRGKTERILREAAEAMRGEQPALPGMPRPSEIRVDGVPEIVKVTIVADREKPHVVAYEVLDHGEVFQSKRELRLDRDLVDRIFAAALEQIHAAHRMPESDEPEETGEGATS